MRKLLHVRQHSTWLIVIIFKVFEWQLSSHRRGSRPFKWSPWWKSPDSFHHLSRRLYPCMRIDVQLLFSNVPASYHRYIVADALDLNNLFATEPSRHKGLILINLNLFVWSTLMLLSLNFFLSILLFLGVFESLWLFLWIDQVKI